MKFLAVFLFLAFVLTAVLADPSNKNQSRDHEADEVGDFQFYQGPLTNIIRTIQNLLKRSRNQREQNDETFASKSSKSK